MNIPKLGECCEIEVNVDDNGNFFIGKIYFSAERIRVKITGEEHGDRKIKVFAIPSPLKHLFRRINPPKNGNLVSDGLNRNTFWNLRKQF